MRLHKESAGVAAEVKDAGDFGAALLGNCGGCKHYHIHWNLDWLPKQ
jgi:hypothetical protein